MKHTACENGTEIREQFEPLRENLRLDAGFFFLQTSDPHKHYNEKEILKSAKNSTEVQK